MGRHQYTITTKNNNNSGGGGAETRFTHIPLQGDLGGPGFPRGSGRSRRGLKVTAPARAGATAADATATATAGAAAAAAAGGAATAPVRPEGRRTDVANQRSHVLVTGALPCRESCARAVSPHVCGVRG